MSVTLSELQIPLDRLFAIDRQALIGRLAGGIAHDTNGPLAAVVGYAQALRAEGLGASTATEDLLIIESEAMRASELLRELMIFARPDGQPQPAPAVSLSHVVQNATRFTSFLARKRHVAIRAEMAEADLQASCPPEIAEYMVMELLHNAIRATLEGCIVLAVAIHDGVVQISVTSSGRLPEGQIPEDLFEPFYTTHPDGTGLGLPLVRALTVRAGGTCTLEAAPEGGLAARLELPQA